MYNESSKAQGMKSKRNQRNLEFWLENRNRLKPAYSLWFIYFFLGLGFHLFSQSLTPTSANINAILNTAYTTSVVGGITVQTIAPAGFLDPYWTCGLTPNGGASASVTPVNSSCFQSNQTGWIGPSFAICPGTPPSYFACGSNTFISYCYVRQFTVGTSPFVINLDIWATGWVEEILVNGIPAHKTGGTYLSHPFHANTTNLKFNWCNWVPGLNTIAIRVCNTNVTPHCQYTGLLVKSYLPQTYAYPSITGPTLACPSSTNIYSLPTKTALAIPNPTVFLYKWYKPNTGLWGGGVSSTNTVSIITGTNTGLIGAHIYSTYVSAGTTFSSCISSASFQINVPPPLTITPTFTNICNGKCVTISAIGATNYSWYAPPNNITPYAVGPTSSVICPNGNTSITVKGKSQQGNCVSSKSSQINVMATPGASIAFSPTTGLVCQGSSASLFGSTNILNPTYFWAPVWLGTSVISVNPTQNTTYTLFVQAPNSCTNQAIVSLSVIPNPTITVVAQPSIICLGSSSTLTASGGNTYFWPFNFSQQASVTVSPVTLGNTIYQVNGYGSNNCMVSKTVQVTVLTAPTVTISPVSICSGISNTLSAGGANSYTWTIGTAPNQTISNNPSVVINVVNTTTFSVCGSTTTTGGCVSCTTGVLSPGNPVPLSAPNVTLCTNTGPCTPISVTSSLNVPLNYTWSPGPLPPTASLIVCPTVTTIYSVNVTSSGTTGCPSSATLAVSIETNCCSQSTVGMIALNPTNGLGGNHFNNSYVLGGNITLTASTSFSNAEVWMMPNVQITVPSGMYLELDKTHLFSCGINMWKGIEVQDGGRIKTAPNHPLSYSSLIEDAEIAVDLSNITVANSSPNPPIDLQGVIFNKNFIGIRISHSSPTMDSLALGINGCVFSSRSLTYTTIQNLPLNWPNSTTSCGAGGLRCAVNPTTGLTTPYTFQGYAQSLLKQPHQSQPGHIGIQIEKFGDPAGVNSKPGVQFGISYPGPFPTDFNLFDGLGCGIEITDASLTTMNNVFQNMQRYNYPATSTLTYGGQGISHVIQPNTLMNARLYLTQDGTPGNQFWNCITGVYAFNVYDLWIRNCLFRSDHNIGMLSNFQATAGDTGISLTTNRFNFTVIESQFNNLRYGIVVSTATDNLNYDVTGNGPIQGILMNSFTIERNYFGPLVTSNTPYSGGVANSAPSEYMEEAIRLQSPNTFGWATHPTQFGISFVISNKIDRVFRGVTLDGFEDTKLWIQANDIFIEDDFTFGQPAFGYGIGTANHIDNLAIINNTLNAQPWFLLSPNYPTVSLVYTKNHFGTNSPRIECNSTSNSYYGFEFSGRSSGTIWEGNEMCTHFAGLALTNTAVIGQQGDPIAGLGSGNVWIWMNYCWPWGSFRAPYYTYCDDSDPALSMLYVKPQLDRDPTILSLNGSSNTNPFNPPVYSLGVSIDNTAPADRLFDCVPQHGALPPPNWRIPNGLDEYSRKLNEEIVIYPNPTDALLYLELNSTSGNFHVIIFNLTGTKVYESFIINKDNNDKIDLSTLEPSVYIVEIRKEQELFTRKKLIISK